MKNQNNILLANKPKSNYQRASLQIILSLIVDDRSLSPLPPFMPGANTSLRITLSLKPDHRSISLNTSVQITLSLTLGHRPMSPSPPMLGAIKISPGVHPASTGQSTQVHQTASMESTPAAMAYRLWIRKLMELETMRYNIPTAYIASRTILALAAIIFSAQSVLHKINLEHLESILRETLPMY